MSDVHVGSGLFRQDLLQATIEEANALEPDLVAVVGDLTMEGYRWEFEEAKGFFGRRKNLYKTAKEAVERAWRYSYRDRKNRKREFRHRLDHVQRDRQQPDRERDRRPSFQV